MKEDSRYVLGIVVATSIFLAACGDKKGEEGSSAATGKATVAGESLILAARDQGAFLPVELADPRYADEATLPMSPFKLPPADFSTAGNEVEPNNTRATATLVGQAHAVRGQVAAGDNDFFEFETTGDPQLWTLEASGKSVSAIVYEAPGNEVSALSQRLDSATLIIPNLYLPAGKHMVMVRAAYVTGAYTLRAVPLGKPDLRMEREPNDAPAFAHPLQMGIPRVGLIIDRVDVDQYSFSLSETAHVLLQVTSPPDLSLVVNLSRQAGPFHSVSAKLKGESLRLDVILPPGDYVALIKSNDNGSLSPYKIRVDELDPFVNPADSASAKAPFTVSLKSGPHIVEAFSTLSQSTAIPVTIHNSGAQRIELALDGVVGHSAWSVSPGSQMVSVDPGKDKDVQLQLNIPPDAPTGQAIQVAVRASSSSGKASATTKVYPLCGATAVNAHTWVPLPESMMGGLNLAATSLGGRPVAPGIKLAREQMLYDGMTPSDQIWTGDRTTSEPELLLTVALGGDRPATIAGVTLIPGFGNADVQVDKFDILVSEDGQAYRQVMSGRLRAAKIEQAFVFPEPVRARFAQLRIVSNQGSKPNSRSLLGEFKVIAAPGEHPFAASEFNLADPARGGHVVWSQPLFGVGDAVLTLPQDGQEVRLDTGSPNEWIVGFRHNRAAQISRLEWVQPLRLRGIAKKLSTVEVSISAESPIGPWTSVGTWKLSATPGSNTPLNLGQPVWARFVRFSTTEPKVAGQYWELAESIRIFERAPDATYRSVLAEWGHYARPAIYERIVPPPPVSTVAEVTGNGKLADAKKIENNKPYRGRVTVGEDEDWYRIAVPAGHNRLRLNFQGDPVLRAVASLQDESGKIIPAEMSAAPGGITRVEAILEGGRTYFLRLIEPPRSIALVWDNSSSIRNFSTPMYKALSRFAESVKPEREFVNLLPLAVEPRFLMSKWSDQPFVLQRAVQNYDRHDPASNAEYGLLAAVRGLEPRQGSKAILFITDANSDGYAKTSELWAALSRVPTRVFAVELQLGNQVEKQQRLMEDWANDGHYSTFMTSQDLDVAFDRTSCYLRRPARYTLIVDTRFEELPAPGSIEVALAPEAVAENAVEIILDASGSMLQMLGNSRRMDIARNTLVELVEKTLPAGTPFAFRAFGTRIANCESDLLLKIQPLDRAKVGGMVRKLNATNLAKTPIGASLRAVAEDLKGVKGRKTVVLLTDGEETCGGDPAASIQYLKQQGLDVGVNIVGFAVDDANLKVNFERWATLGGGRFFDAKNGQELSKALTDAMRPKFQVTDATGSVVGEGTAGGAPVELPVGTYTVRVLTSPVRTFERVKVNSKARQRIDVK